MNTIQLPENITRLRKEKKITQEALAEYIGVTKASVSKWETGQCMPDMLLLPQLASFFDVTVDELIGYIPQLSKEQIQKLYQKFTKDFAECPFEQVMSETKDYVKRYYSCYPFLLQICILWLNHYRMAQGEERQKEICIEIEKLCNHIKDDCKDMKIHTQAVSFQALVYFQIGRIQDVVDNLEEYTQANRFASGNGVLLAQAYAMLGNDEKAEEISQVNMYENVMNLIANATVHLSIHAQDLAACEQTLYRIESLIQAYKIDKLNPNSLANFEYQAASCYLLHGQNDKAINHIDKFERCISSLFAEQEIQFHGDDYFDKIEKWFENELDNGTNAPRNRKVVLEEVKKTLDVPPFCSLNGDVEFEKIKNRLKEIN